MRPSARTTSLRSGARRGRRCAGVHTDTAACGRPSLATIDTAAHHMRREAEIGGYVAEAAVEPETDAGRALLGRLLGRAAGDVCFVESAELALHRVLRAWPAWQGATVAALPGEYGPNLAAFAAHGLRVIPLPADGAGRSTSPRRSVRCVSIGRISFTSPSWRAIAVCSSPRPISRRYAGPPISRGRRCGAGPRPHRLPARCRRDLRTLAQVVDRTARGRRAGGVTGLRSAAAGPRDR